VYDVYKLLDEKMRTCKKPIFPILPSIINVNKEIEYFISLGRINFPDEVIFGKALCKIYNTPEPAPEIIPQPDLNYTAIRAIIGGATDGYLHPEKVQELFDAAGIPSAGEAVVTDKKDAIVAASNLGLPVVMKVVGPVHKSDVGGVVLDVKNFDQVAIEFDRMIQIKDTTAILIQPMLSGHSVYIGAKKEPKFGHMVLCGLGGIYIEVLKDVQSSLTPVSKEEASGMIARLKSYKIIEGVRGQEGLNQELFAEIITRVSALCLAAPEIAEMDINPLMGNMKTLKAVDARIRIEKLRVGSRE
jgi:acetyltransferase